MHSLRIGVLAAVAAIGAAALAPSAAACGGTFCDVGPTVMPVDQTGENILFVVDGTSVEAHVQIQYTGDPKRFAWVVPMPQVPDVTVGSQALFDRILGGTRPSYGYQTTFDDCIDQSCYDYSDYADASASYGSDGASDAAPDVTTDAGGAEVLLRKTVGAFDVVVLKGGTAKEVVDWLDANNYQSITTAPGILDKYVTKGYVFAALKLTAGAGLDEIHPIVFSYSPGAPCVPIELTAVAAVENMAIRTFFLSSGRMVPSNYRHVTVNPLKIDWLNLGSNYSTVVTKAVDGPGASGHAFVTEYAGSTSAVVSSGDFVGSQWDSAKLAATTPENVVAELEVQGLLSCSTIGSPDGGVGGGYCAWPQPLLEAILDEYLPRPPGVSEDDFYTCVSCFPDAGASTWDAAAFAADVQTRIFDPAVHAADVVAKHAYLTRMYTTISPSEMTADPEFQLRDDLPEVPLPGLATQRYRCDGTMVFELPDGRSLRVPDSSWPTFSSLPWAETVLDIPATGAPIALVDKSSDIADALTEWNDLYGGTVAIPQTEPVCPEPSQEDAGAPTNPPGCVEARSCSLSDGGLAPGVHVLPDGAVVYDDGGHVPGVHVLPDGAFVYEDGGLPPGAHLLPDGAIVYDDAGAGAEENHVGATGIIGGCGCSTPTGKGSPRALALLAVAGLALRRRRRT